MKQYLSGAAGAAIAGAAMLLSLGATPAQAQVPGGSYLQSCSNVRASGDRIVAQCRRTDGSWTRTALHDANRCVGGIANMNGQLTCNRRGGRQQGWNREQRWDRGDGYGSSHRPENRYRQDFSYNPYGYGR